MEKKEFIDNLFKQTSDFKNEKQSSMVANLLDTVSSDIYSESQRFVFELIQNADDAAEGKKNEVHFDFIPGALIVSHNGKPFGKPDIDSITDAGSSTKRDDPNKTGYKGIGFKSVFGMSERVSIFSDGYQFRFEKAHHSSHLPWQIIPIWSDIDDYNSDISIILKKSSYRVTTIIELPVVDTLYNDLQEIMDNGQILLFLRFVSKITVSKNAVLKYTLSKNIVEETLAFSKVSLYRDSTVISDWLVKNYKAIPIPKDTREKLKKDKKAPEKLRNAEFTEMSFAAKLEKNKITGIGNGQSLIFTYLPTKVREFSFPFLVNGGFMTSAAREALFEDSLWNQWLFSLIAEKTVAWLCELAGSNYRLQVLNIMPTLFNQNSNHLKQSFDTAFTVHAKHGDFINTSRLSLKNSSSVLLDATGLSTQTFIDKFSITEFIRLSSAKNFQPDCFVHAELEKSQLLKAIGVETFDKENIGPYFSSDAFKNSHQLAENFRLIVYLKKLSDSDSSGVWFQTLKDLPFIFDTDQVLCNPENGVCFPTGIVHTELGDIPVIHSDVYREIESNKPIYDWLVKLGVTEPSTLAYVTNVIIPNLSDPDYINIDNYLDITNYLFRLFNKGELNIDILESLRSLKILTTSTPAEFIVAEKAFLSNRYRPKFPIEDTISQMSFVSEIYLAHGDDLKWNDFFTAIKVKEDIEIEVINSNNDLNTLIALTDSGWVDLAKKEARASADLKGQWGFAMYNKINNLKIPSLLNLTVVNYDYAVAFWKRLIDAGNRIEELKEKGVFMYGEGYGKNRFSASVTNYFPWFVANIKCIPTSTGELLRATEVFINTGDIKEIAGKLMPVFEFPTTVPTAWRLFFNFKTELVLTDYLLLLEKICADAEVAEPKERGRVQRIGMIYNKIAIILADTAEKDKDVISDWAAHNRVLTGKDVFEDPKTLKWVIIPGFSDDSTNLETIKIPSNTDHKISGFTELMRLFGIQIISEFVPSYNQAVLDSSLKSKLENILPHLVALADKKTVGDPQEKFDKLYGILNQTTFFSAKEIKLGFEFEGENFDGPIMSIYKDNYNIYFKGKWTSERTLLHLIKELADLLKLRQLDSELRFLLMEADPREIADWMAEQGIQLRTLIPVRRFTSQIIIDSPQSAEYPLSPNNSNQGNRSEAEEMFRNTEDYFEADETSNGNFGNWQEPQERQKQTSSVFIPVTLVKGLDFTNRPLSSPSTRVISVSQERQYEKIEDEEYRVKVGNWSEEYVNELLKLSPEFSRINWINEHGESKQPFDFTAIRNEKLIYIEVKGTQSNDKNLIYLSHGEWQVMRDNTENYLMFRIYRAGTEQSWHEIFENPSALIDNGYISIALEL